MGKRTFDGDIDVQIRDGSLTEDFGVLFHPLVGADEAVLFGTPAAEHEAPSRAPICHQEPFVFSVMKRVSKQRNLLSVCLTLPKVRAISSMHAVPLDGSSAPSTQASR